MFSGHSAQGHHGLAERAGHLPMLNPMLVGNMKEMNNRRAEKPVGKPPLRGPPVGRERLPGKPSSKLAGAMRDSHGQFGTTRLRWAVTARGKTLSPSSPTTCGTTMCCKSRFFHFQDNCCEDATPNVSSATPMLSSPCTSSSTQTDMM